MKIKKYNSQSLILPQSNMKSQMGVILKFSKLRGLFGVKFHIFEKFEMIDYIRILSFINTFKY